MAQGDQFFPGLALPGDQDGHVLRGDAADGLVHLDHGRAGADDGTVHVRVRVGLGDHGRWRIRRATSSASPTTRRKWCGSSGLKR